MTPLVLDFETHAIQSRPAYPPEPIGVSLKEFGQPAEYLAWGHKTGNNTTKEKALKHLKKVTKGRDVLCHNYAFDIEVLEKHCDIAIPHWSRSHDTMWVLFLYDPNMKSLGLKQSAEEILGWPADERDAVREWLLENQPVPGVKISRGPKNEHYYMKYLSWAPGDLVGKYANGDVERTEAIFEKLHSNIIARGMGAAYDRERRLFPVLNAMEKRGVRVDLSRLRQDVSDYSEIQVKIDAWLRQKLGRDEFFNLDSDAFVDALVEAGLADVTLMGLTKTGKISTNKEAIANGVTDKQTAAVAQYRAQLHTALDTFMRTWLKMAEASGGFIYTTWNQVRGSGKGARTGRLSSTPPFMNIPKIFSPIFSHEEEGLPVSPIENLRPLPMMRSYVIPYRDDHVLIDRDYAQCEPRILAHFGDSSLMESYTSDPWMDVYNLMRADLSKALGLDVSRQAMKTLLLALIYGMGAPELARRLGVSLEEARRWKAAVFRVFPEVSEIYQVTRAMARKNEPVVTTGGRENYCEPPGKNKTTGAAIDWSYRLPNTMIQGSAADEVKEAMIRYAEAAPEDHLMLIQIHDQLLVSVPKDQIVIGHDILRYAMQSIGLDVPLLSEGKWSPDNWASLRPFDEKGVMVAENLPEQISA